MAPNFLSSRKRSPALTCVLPTIQGARQCNLPLVGVQRSGSSASRAVQDSPQHLRCATSASSATGMKGAWSEEDACEDFSVDCGNNPQDDFISHEVSPFAAKAEEIKALSQQMELPNVVVTGMIFDLIRRISANLPTHKHLIDALMGHLECAVYSSGAEQREDVELLGTEKMPSQYLYRVPYFSVVRQQREKMLALKKRFQMQQYILDGSGSLKSSALTVLTRMQRMNSYTIRAWLFAFWKVFHMDQKQYRGKVSKFTIQSVSDLLRPFLHWRIYMYLTDIENDLSTQRDMELEQKMLNVEVEHLTERSTELQNDLQTSENALQSLQKTLEEEREAHKELQCRWATTRPELLKSTLCESLDLFFSFVIRAASLKQIEVKRSLMTKELGVLVQNDEESIQKVATMPCEQLLLRWVNHHVTQCKVTASELIDSASKERVNDTRSAWSTKDIESFRDRCKVVRNLQKISNLDEDLKDSVVLAALYAMLKAAKFGQVVLDPADLWPLDQRDLDQRAIALCSAMRSIVPTRKAACLLKPQDVIQGNAEIMVTFLAALFLDEAALPEAEPNKQQMETTSVNKTSNGASKSRTTQGRRSSLDHESPMTYVIANMEVSSAQIAYDPLQDPCRLLQNHEQLPDLLQLPSEQLLLRWINLQLTNVYDKKVENFGDLENGIVLFLMLNVVAQDVLPSMHGSSDSKERIRLVVEYGCRCTDFDVLSGDALHQGHADILAAFLASLFLNRPHLEVEENSKLMEHVQLLEGVIHTGYAALATEGPTGPPSIELTEFCAQLEGQHDGIEGALKAVHSAREVMSIIEERMRGFLEDILAQRARGNPRSMAAAKEARDFLRHTALNPERIRVLLAKEESGKDPHDNDEDDEGSMLVGDSHVLEDTKKEKESKVNDEEESKLRQKDLMLQVEDLLRKHFSLFREMYKYYAESLPGGGKGITAESVLRIYQDCKLRSTKFHPYDVENIFKETLSAVESGKENDEDKTEEEKGKEKERNRKDRDKDKDNDDGKDKRKGEDATEEKNAEKEESKGLPPEGFVEVMLHIAVLRYTDVGSLPEKLITLIQKNLKPHACRESENFFHKMAYDPEVRSVLRTQTKDLAVVFEVYSAIDTEEGGREHLHTMNVKEFHIMLSHCQLLDAKFDEAAVNTIFENIQHEEEEDAVEVEDFVDEEAEESDGEAEYIQFDVDADSDIVINDDDVGAGPRKARFGHQHTGIDERALGLQGVGDDDELAYSEFLDGLVAIVMYKDPNPFVAFHERVSTFLKDHFFKGLHQHWASVAEADQSSVVRTKLVPRLNAMYGEPATVGAKKEGDTKGAKDTKGDVEPMSPKRIKFGAKDDQ